MTSTSIELSALDDILADLRGNICSTSDIAATIGKLKTIKQEYERLLGISHIEGEEIVEEDEGKITKWYFRYYGTTVSVF